MRREAQVREQAVRLRSEIDSRLTDRREQVLKIEERVLLAKELEDRAEAGDLTPRPGVSPGKALPAGFRTSSKETKNAQLGNYDVAALTQAEARALLLERRAGAPRQRGACGRSTRRVKHSNLVADALQRRGGCPPR